MMTPPPLISAIIHNQNDLINSLIQHHDEVYDGLTALAWAAIGGNLYACEKLLSFGAHVERGEASEILDDSLNKAKAVYDVSSHTDCRVSIGEESEHAQKYCDCCISTGEEIEHQSRKGKPSSPLMLAANRGHSSIARLLLLHGAKVNRQNTEGQTALFLAVESAETCQVLLENGANVKHQDAKGLTPIFCAIERRCDIHCIQLLLSYGAAESINQFSYQGHSVLTMAAMLGLTEICTLLLENGACWRHYAPDHATICFQRMNALMFAAKTGSLELCDTLLRRGADARGALSIAAGYGHANICALLVDSRELDPGTRDGNEEAVSNSDTMASPFQLALWGLHDETARVLFPYTSNALQFLPIFYDVRDLLTDDIKLLYDNLPNTSSKRERRENLETLIRREVYLPTCVARLNRSAFLAALQLVRACAEITRTCDHERKIHRYMRMLPAEMVTLVFQWRIRTSFLYRLLNNRTVQWLSSLFLEMVEYRQARDEAS